MSGYAARLTDEVATRVGLREPRDDRLVRLAARGDGRALEAIYRRYHQPIYRYCRAIVHDPDLAEDALAATMLKAVSALRGETRAIALKPWLFRIAHNEAIDLLRSRHPLSELDPEQPAVGAEVDGSVAQRERLRQLVADLGCLPERQRGALVMRELNGLSFDEIGAAFGIGPEAAKQSVYEARVSLQEIAAGREMDCDRVRQSISARDRRLLRSRRIRSHLRQCHACADFAAAIDRRRADLGALAPPLAVPSAAAALQAILGSGGAAAGGSGIASAGLGVGGAAAVKSAAAVLAAVAVAGGAADFSGLIDVGGSGGSRGDRAAPPAPSAAPAHPGARAVTPAAVGSEAGPVDRPGGSPAASDHRGKDASPGQSGQDHGPRGPEGAAAAGTPPPHATAAGDTPPGQAPTPPGQSMTPPGQSQPPSPAAGAAPQSVSHSNPQAAAQSSSASHSQAGARAGVGAATPDQTAQPPTGQALGQAAAAIDKSK